MKFLRIFVLGVLFLGVVFINEKAQAHPGRTDSSGCHTCRTNCSSWGLSTGEYHCHNAKSSVPQPEEPIKSVYGENGTGHTEPAPEYKAPQGNSDDSKGDVLSLTETKDNSGSISTMAMDTDKTDSSFGTFSIIALVGVAGYFIGKKKTIK